MPEAPKTPPVSLNEAMIDRHFATDPLNNRAPIADPVLSALREAMHVGRLAAERATKIADALLADEMQTVPARHKRVKVEAWRAAEGPLKRFDAALAAAKHEIASVEQRTEAPPKPTGAIDQLLAGEIRSRLASMPDDKRREALENALVEGSDEVLGAVLNGPHMLSGLSAPAAANLRERWRRIRHDSAVERLDRLKAAVVDAERGGTLLLGYVGTLADARILEKAEASETAAREALAS